METGECSPRHSSVKGAAEPFVAGRGQRDRLFFIVYAGLLVFGFLWVTFSHVQRRTPDADIVRIVLVAGLCYLALRALVVLSRRGSDRLEYVWVSADIVLITVLVYLTGGIHSEAALMYLLPIFTYSIQRRIFGVLAVGACSAILYTVATWPADLTYEYIGELTTRLVVVTLVTLVATCYAIHETDRINELAQLRARVTLGEYRRELSAEIHDGIQHYLVSMAMRLEMVKRLAETDAQRAAKIASEQRFVLRQAADELRYLIRRLRAPALEHHGFVEAIREHVDLFGDRSSMRTSMTVEGTPALMSADADHAAFRIVQESLMNAEKHSQATEITVTLKYGHEQLECTVADNGVGFDPTQVGGEPDLEGGFGFTTMRQRAEQAGGTLEVDSAPGEGARISFIVPLKAAAVPAAGAADARPAMRKEAEVEAAVIATHR